MDKLNLNSLLQHFEEIDTTLTLSFEYKATACKWLAYSSMKTEIRGNGKLSIYSEVTKPAYQHM